jgi:hypothetical protein
MEYVDTRLPIFDLSYTVLVPKPIVGPAVVYIYLPWQASDRAAQCLAYCRKGQ